MTGLKKKLKLKLYEFHTHNNPQDKIQEHQSRSHTKRKQKRKLQKRSLHKHDNFSVLKHTVVINKNPRESLFLLEILLRTASKYVCKSLKCIVALHLYCTKPIEICLYYICRYIFQGGFGAK